MPSVTYAQYCKIADLDSSKTTEKKEHKKLDEMKNLSFSDFYGQYGAEGLSHFTVADLKEELTAQGLSTHGVKADLISRLEEHYKDHKRKSDSDKHSDSKHQKTADVDLEGKNPGNVIGGYKATLHNPNASEEAKEHAQEVLDEMGVDADEKADSSKNKRSDGSTEGKNPHNVAGGFKATLHNPNVSDEAKEHAQEMLDEMGVDADEKADSSKRSSGSTEGKNKGNVIGGYRATLHNPNVSDEAKEHAKKMLKELGAHETDHSTDADVEGKNLGNVIGGYRAALHNPNTSDEAKDHARKVLKELGVNPEGHADSESSEGKNPNNVAGGYKATLHNPNASQEAKDHARQKLEEMGVDADEPADSQKTYHEADTTGKNPGNVIGGYKATLKNPNVSEEAKENAEKQLEKLGADADESPKKSSGSHIQDAESEGKNPGNVIGGYKATLKNPNVSEEAKRHAKQELASSKKA